MDTITLTFTQGAIAFAIIFSLGVGLGFFHRRQQFGER